MRKSKAEREREQAAAEQRRQMVDEFGRLEAELSPIKPKQKRFEDLAKIIRSWHQNSEPNETLTEEGNEFDAILGPRGMETHFAPASEIYRALGHETFLRCASITVKALEANADAAAVSRLTHKERTGSRPLLIAARTKAKAA